MKKRAEFRFYEELNDFIPPGLRKTAFPYEFTGSPAVKDAIEAIGVPHVEVDLILADGVSVPFTHHLEDGERIAVYPMFESLDIGPVARLRPAPLREPRFILDVHLGTLVRYLRLLGFDAVYENDFEDAEIVAIAAREGRIILTRDVGLLKHGEVTRGYWIRSADPREQVRDILRRFDLRGAVAPFTRCMVCNGPVAPVTKADILDILEPLTARHYDTFSRCASCGRIYWQGSHWRKMRAFLDSLVEDTNAEE